MPRKIWCVSVFLSFPSNMAIYAEKIEGIISVFNDIYGFDKGVVFRIVHWKKNSIGQVSDDAQLAINKQLLEKYDLMIALIGDRLGEATARAESGTAEEIRNAIGKKDQVFGGKHIQVIFKTKIESSINHIDVNQLTRVKDFRLSVQKLALVAEFNEDHEVDGIVNRFLHSAIQSVDKFNSEPGSMENMGDVSLDENVPSIVDVEVDVENDGGLGFFDELERAKESSDAQGELISAYGSILTDMTAQMNDILDRFGQNDQKKKFDLIGELLFEKADRMDSIVKDMRIHADNHASSFENVLLMFDEFGKGELENDAVRNVKETLLDTSESMGEFVMLAIQGKEATENSPRATQKFNQGKRRVAKAMGEMISLTEALRNRFNEYASYLDSFLKKES